MDATKKAIKPKQAAVAKTETIDISRRGFMGGTVALGTTIAAATLKGGLLAGAATALTACGDGTYSGGGNAKTDEPYIETTALGSTWGGAFVVYAMPGVKPSETAYTLELLETSSKGWWDSGRYDAVKTKIDTVNVAPSGTQPSLDNKTITIAHDITDVNFATFMNPIVEAATQEILDQRRQSRLDKIGSNSKTLEQFAFVRKHNIARG